MKKILGLAMILFISLVFFSCASGDADILSIDLDGAVVVGKPKIDTAAKTVDVTVEPVDLTKVKPSLSVSTGATISSEKLKDGELVTFKVTAENGSEAEWKVKVTVSPGISFTYGTTDVVLMKGVIDSDNYSNSVKIGNGVPYGAYNTSEEEPYTVVVVFLEEQELKNSDTIEETALCSIWVKSKTTGDQSDKLDLFMYSTGLKSSPMISVKMDKDKDVSFNVTEYGAIGGYITGSFSCSNADCSKNEGVASSVAVSNGFFKVLRLADV